MTRDEALDKIRKCLALAASPEPHEAAAALRQAQKLMAQYGLTEMDVTLADVSEVRQPAQNAPMVRWELSLAWMVAQAFGCHTFTIQRPKFGNSLQVRQQRFYVFVGVGPAPEVAGYAFEVLTRQCARDRRRYIGLQSKNCKASTKVARGDLYAEGWLSGVQDKLYPLVGNERDIALTAQYMEQRHPDMQPADVGSRVKGRNVTDNDWHRGLQAGRAAELARGMEGRAAQPLLPS
ncbi:DUF2786 domain-containing protein [Acidovorax sp. SUPP2522]|uniref:DUF2786 domain-containing protein n=1 Tax=unclassified Acidovorax TaxID=2684926 RepID=UPI00234BF08B|nr:MULTISPECIES: DUF2786 domain-containing protein [unclassified Acidovorax]WCM99939.1 DUF2786 domain-containing protein [Acidovorax sp. GBBC 1281]GKT19761.1 DUF2786 domain-containing protein [Acidovorax sp. SUPP2522]